MQCEVPVRFRSLRSHGREHRKRRSSDRRWRKRRRRDLS